MKNLLFSAIASLTLFCNVVLAQDKIYMMNGGVYDVKVLSIDSSKIKMDYAKKSETKTISIDKEDVFSIKYADGKEVVFYQQDSLSEDGYMTVAEMSDYVAGQRDAVKGFKSPGTSISSVVVGAASPFLSTLIIGSFFLAPIPAAAFIGVAGAQWIKINRTNVSDPKYLKSDTYVMGYDHAARGKRLQNALIGSGAGLVAGVVTTLIISSIKSKNK